MEMALLSNQPKNGDTASEGGKWVSDALYPGLSMYVPNFDEVQRQYDEEVAQVAPDSDAAAVALLRLASVYVDIGYPLIMAPRLICIEEPEYPSDASEVSMQRLQ